MKTARGIVLGLLFYPFVGVQPVSPTFELGFRGCPDPRSGLAGSAFTADIEATLTTANNPTLAGARSWSISMGAEGVRISSITTDGTAGATRDRGGFQKGGFETAEVTGPGGSGPQTPENAGAVSAVVLSFQSPVTLPPEGTVVIAMLRLEGSYPVDTCCKVARVSYINGRQGSDAPVENTVVFGEEVYKPGLGACSFSLCGFDCGGHFDSPVRYIFQQEPISAAGHQVVGTPEVGAVTDIDSGGGGVAAPHTRAYVGISSILPGRSGVQGWSISAAVTGDIAVTSVTTSGTAAAPFPEGVVKGGFEVAEIVDPSKLHPDTRAPQGPGFVSAVVVSFTSPIELAPVGTATVLCADVARAAGPTACEARTGRIIFRDGMTGTGMAVQNEVTADGGTLQVFSLPSLTIRFAALLSPPGFLRGDANGDGRNNVADAVWIVNELFRSGPTNPCQDASDANDDGRVDLADAMYIISYQFRGGPPPSGLLSGCSADPTEDALPCTGRAGLCAGGGPGC